MSQQVNVYRELNVGTSAAPVKVVAAGTPVVNIYTTSPSTAAGTSVEPLYMKSTMTGVGGVGGRARFHMYTNVALGGWSNALKGYAEYGASGRTTGLGSAVCAELVLSAGTTQGTYAPLESELVAGSGAKPGTATSFLYCNAGIDTDSVINGASGFLFELGAGITDTAGGIFETEAVTSWDATHVLKCRIRGTTYYIPLNTVKNN